MQLRNMIWIVRWWPNSNVSRIQNQSTQKENTYPSSTVTFDSDTNAAAVSLSQSPSSSASISIFTSTPAVSCIPKVSSQKVFFSFASSALAFSSQSMLTCAQRWSSHVRHDAFRNVYVWAHGARAAYNARSISERLAWKLARIKIVL